MKDWETKSQMYEQFARVGKALGHATRLQLLDFLAQGRRTVESLSAASGVSLVMVSQHLRALKEAGLVRSSRRGTFVEYRLSGEDVAGLLAMVRTVSAAYLADAERAAAAYLGALGDELEPLDAEALMQRVRAGRCVVLDVRPTEEYASGHIPGAISIPLADLESRIHEISGDVEVVAYCRGAFCVLASDAVHLLTRHGRRATRLHDGMLEWRLAGRPVEVAVA